MFERSSLRVWTRFACSAGAVAALGVAVPAAASAAPQSSTSCNGRLSKAPTSDEPNTLAYKFHCNGGITGYTLIVNRRRNDFSTIDDFSPDALVYDTGGHVVTSTAFGCEGEIPGNGINCNAGGSYLPAADYVRGTFDTTDPYCPSIPAGSRAGTKPLPPALVQLVVSDTTGAQDGPFRLGLARACKPAHRVKPSARRHKKRKAGARHQRRRIQSKQD